MVVYFSSPRTQEAEEGQSLSAGWADTMGYIERICLKKKKIRTLCSLTNTQEDEHKQNKTKHYRENIYKSFPQ